MPGLIYFHSKEYRHVLPTQIQLGQAPPRHPAARQGLNGRWARLAARAAFRPGQSNYCGYRNDVELASWVGGIVGLKSILGINNREKALEIINALTELGYISYTLDKATKKLSYTIKDWVVECSGASCSDGAVYATDGYGFLCLPRNITQRLVEAQYQFEEGCDHSSG